MKDTKLIRRDFYLLPGSCPGTLGAGVPRWSKNYFFFKHGHVAYQINEDDKQNRMQVKFLFYGQTGGLEVR